MSMRERLDTGDQFWMGNLAASGLVEVTDDPDRLSDGGFWAVSIAFDGAMIFAKFKDIREEAFPDSSWKPLAGQWESSLDQIEFMNYVEEIRNAIAIGDVYQVNACRILKVSLGSKPEKLTGLFSQILKNNPAPFAAYLNIPGLEIASASPERFLSRSGSSLITSPIKGTIRSDQVEFGEKDRAENLMIVDLMRNDLGHIARTGSVKVTELFRSEQHPGLTHLVSDITAELDARTSWRDIFSATTPPGSISGAPKSTALKIIANFEGNSRGPYCGALGWIHGDRAELSVAIRTFWRGEDNFLRFGTGAGITWASSAQSEWDETELKAKRLISIAGGQL